MISNLFQWFRPIPDNCDLSAARVPIRSLREFTEVLFV